MVRTIIGQTAGHLAATPGWIPAVMIVGTGIISLGVIALIFRNRWWQIYLTVTELLQFVQPESRHFSRQVHQYIQRSALPRHQQRWLTIMLVYHLRHLPRRQHRPWRIVWIIWRRRHIQCVPYPDSVTSFHAPTSPTESSSFHPPV